MTYRCDFCPWTGSTESALEHHIEYKHRGINPTHFKTGITAVMPTILERRHFLPCAFRSFLHQTHVRKEMVVVAGEKLHELLPESPLIRFVPCGSQEKPIGFKRNLGAVLARNRLVTHWDDDDWMAPERLEDQVQSFNQVSVKLSGTNEPRFYDLESRECFSYRSNGLLLAGSSLTYAIDTWRTAGGFPDVNDGEDHRFIRAVLGPDARRGDPRISYINPDLNVALLHRANTASSRPVKGMVPVPLLPCLPFPPRSVALCVLSWNTAEATEDSVLALVHEANCLAKCGHRVSIHVLDNGSTDGTAERLVRVLAKCKHTTEYHHLPENQGISIGRNWLIDSAINVGADYLLFLDGDIEIIPGTLFGFLSQMEADKTLGCVGLYSGKYSKHRSDCTEHLYSFQGMRVDRSPVIAWTQYGLFRASMFHRGIRFETAGAFGGPGWGFEDNDLAFQMLKQGYGIQCHHGATYLHRAKMSSVANLKRTGFNIQHNLEGRRQILRNKWASDPIIAGKGLLGQTLNADLRSL